MEPRALLDQFMSLFTSLMFANCSRKPSPPSDAPSFCAATVSCCSARLRMSSRSISSSFLLCWVSSLSKLGGGGKGKGTVSTGNEGRA